MIPEHHLIVVLSSTITSIAPPPPYFHLDINFFTHGTLSSYPFIPLPTLWLTCPSSTSSLLPTGCQYSLHNKLSLFPFPISHPSIHSFIDPLVLLSLQPSSHPLSTTLFLSFFLPVAAKFDEVPRKSRPEKNANQSRGYVTGT